MQLHIQLQSMKRNDLPVAQYLEQIKLFLEELVTTGQPVHLPALNTSVFNNLRLEFSEVVSALAVRGGDPLSFAELTSHKTRFANQWKSCQRYLRWMSITLPTLAKVAAAVVEAVDRGAQRTLVDPCPICGSNKHNPYQCP